MDANPDNRSLPGPPPEPTQAEIRAAGSVLAHATYQVLSHLSTDRFRSFKIYLYREHHPSLFSPMAVMQASINGNGGFTIEILIERAQQWINTLPPNLLLGHALKCYLEVFSQRDRHFQARLPALHESFRALFTQINRQSPFLARMAALSQYTAFRQAQNPDPLHNISQALSRLVLGGPGLVPRQAPPQAPVQAPAQVNQMALNIPEHRAGYARANMVAMYDDCLEQKYTDLKIVCRGIGCVFHVHRLVVCIQSRYLRDAAAALAPGEQDINLPDAEPAIMQLVIDTMYINQFNTGTVLEGVNNNHFLILLEVYAMSKKYGVEIGMDSVLGGLPEVMQNVMSKVNLRLDQRSPSNMAQAHREVTHITEAMKFLSENLEACDNQLKSALRQGFLENRDHFPSQEMRDALLAMPANFLDSLT